MSQGSLNERGDGVRIGAHTGMTGSPCWAPETTTTLLGGYTPT